MGEQPPKGWSRYSRGSRTNDRGADTDYAYTGEDGLDPAMMTDLLRTGHYGHHLADGATRTPHITSDDYDCDDYDDE